MKLFRPIGNSSVPLRIRLSLGSAARLSVAIAVFGVIAYQTVRRAAIDAASGRARAAAYSLAQRATLGLGQMQRTLQEAAADPAVIEALRTRVLSPGARAVLERLPRDSAQTVALGLRSRDGRTTLSLNRRLTTSAYDESQRVDSASFGRVVRRADSMLYEVTAPVYDGSRLLGSVVRLRQLAASPEALRAVSDLMGTGGTVLFGNADGSVWTDFVAPVSGPPPATPRYRKDGASYLVATQGIAGTPYLFAAEFPEALVMAPVRAMIWRFILIGIGLVGIGLAASLWSHTRLIRPLTELADAANTITAEHRADVGNPSGGDEIARLQRSFATMTETVRQTQTSLERQIAERTAALEVAEHASAALRASEEALRLADGRKDQFLATLAHELRNPLAPIRNAVEVLGASASSQEMDERSRGIIRRQVSQMSRLLEDLLDISRISHRQAELRLEPVELATVLATAAETSRPAIDARGHALEIELPPGPIVLQADPVRLAQVFSNLLNNSAKFTPPGGKIRLTAVREGANVAVSVTDNGIGLEADAIPHLFEMFSRIKVAGHSESGLGIGLSLVKGFVELHGGSVVAESAGPGQGARFTVRLPVAASAASAEPAPPKQTPAPAAGRRLLIADDLPDSTDSLAEVLRSKGHEVTTAYDGARALEAAERCRPEAIVLDLGMPLLDGYEVCRRIREQDWGKDVLVIALSGWGQPEDRKRSREAGFDFHLVKPYDPPALLDLLAAGVR